LLTGRRSHLVQCRDCPGVSDGVSACYTVLVSSRYVLGKASVINSTTKTMICLNDFNRATQNKSAHIKDRKMSYKYDTHGTKHHDPDDFFCLLIISKCSSTEKTRGKTHITHIRVFHIPN